VTGNQGGRRAVRRGYEALATTYAEKRPADDRERRILDSLLARLDA
jgi:hypothetical protein